jgi:hypothetical protein
MAWEWVAPVVTGVVGIAGVAGAVLSGRRQANVTMQLAREERVQARLERAYQEVERVVERYGQWANATMPFMTVGEHNPHPPPPPGEDGLALEATALRLYWSPEVRRLVQAWTEARNRLMVQSMAAQAHVSLNQPAWLKAPGLKEALRDAEEALLARMAYELQTVEPLKWWRRSLQVPHWRRSTLRLDANTILPALDVQAPHEATNTKG